MNWNYLKTEQMKVVENGGYYITRDSVIYIGHLVLLLSQIKQDMVGWTCS